MLADRTVLTVLADTRSADQVIRLSANATLDFSASTPFDMNDIYLHEWFHYFQFTATPTGILLSQYRRDCFNTLKRLLIASPIHEFDQETFLAKILHFKRMWESWPSDWHLYASNAPGDVTEVSLAIDGLLVKLEHVERPFPLPVGVHAVYEALAWCAAALASDSSPVNPIPRGPEALIYLAPMDRRVAEGM